MIPLLYLKGGIIMVENGKKDKEIIFTGLLSKPCYETIEESLLEINYFRRYKDRVCFMSDDECIDLFKGVVVYYYVARKNKSMKVPENLFENLYDWHRLKFATQRMLNFSFAFELKEESQRKELMGKIIKNEPIDFDLILTDIMSMMIRYCR